MPDPTPLVVAVVTPYYRISEQAETQLKDVQAHFPDTPIIVRKYATLEAYNADRETLIPQLSALIVAGFEVIQKGKDGNPDRLLDTPGAAAAEAAKGQFKKLPILGMPLQGGGFPAFYKVVDGKNCILVPPKKVNNRNPLDFNFGKWLRRALQPAP